MTAIPHSDPDAPHLLVGGGRMARHLAHYLGLQGIPFRRWRRGDGAEALAERARGARTVVLLLSDGAIAPFAAEHDAALGSAPRVHFSGSLRVEGIQACHPLGSFGPVLHADDLYRRITFVCDPGPARFAELFPGLPNPHVVLDPALRPLYHALAVLSGNFSVLLWRKAREGFQEMGVPEEAVVSYRETVLRTLLEAGDEAVTGPLSRGDRETVAANLAALEGDPWGAVYRAVVEASGMALPDAGGGAPPGHDREDA